MDRGNQGTFEHYTECSPLIVVTFNSSVQGIAYVRIASIKKRWLLLTSFLLSLHEVRMERCVQIGATSERIQARTSELGSVSLAGRSSDRSQLPLLIEAAEVVPLMHMCAVVRRGANDIQAFFAVARDD